MEMEDQYGMADLRQLMTNESSSSIPYFPVIPQVHHQQDLLFSGGGSHRNLNLTHAGPNHHHHLHHPHPHHYEMMMLAGSGGGRHHQIQVSHEMLPLHLHTTDSTTTAPPTTTTATTTSAGGAGGGGTSSGTLSGLESADIVGCIGGGGGGGGDGGTGRWPRQETLSLLEIRSRLDHKFKEANQKGPLWDEVSRNMSEEHGYQRSGKKCREKFENLYKYYKKTKEGKAGRQDGKHYRFFRQLEALYGSSEATTNTNNNSNSNNNHPVSLSETHHLIGQNLPFLHSAINNNNNNNSSSHHHQANDHNTTHQEAFQTDHPPKLCDSLSLSNSSEFDTSSSDDSVEKSKKRRGGGGGGGSRRSWKAKIREFIDSQMRKLMEKQEAWLDKMMRTIEHKEQERVSREEEWRKQEAARLDREHTFWASERAWIEARDAALMEALHKLTGGGKEINKAAAAASDAAEFPNENDITSSGGGGGGGGESWPESEITKLIQLRISMESRFQHSECSSEEVLWEEIAAKMGCLGYDHHRRRSAMMCKDKWESINNYLRKTKDCDIYKKRKEDSKSSSSYYQNNNNDDHEISLYNQGLIGGEQGGGPEMLSLLQPNNDGSSSSPPSNSNAGNNTAVQESSFRFFMGDGDHQNLWENYGVKLNNNNNNNNQQGGN